VQLIDDYEFEEFYLHYLFKQMETCSHVITSILSRNSYLNSSGGVIIHENTMQSSKIQ
jgi:hypothetical protein